MLHSHLQSLKSRFNGLDVLYQTFVLGSAPSFPSLKQPLHPLISRFVYFDKLLKVFVTVLCDWLGLAAAACFLPTASSGFFCP